MNTFGSNLKDLMNAKKVSNYQLSKMSGIAKGYITELENGVKDNPSMKIVCKICKVLEVTPNELIPSCLWGMEDGITNDKGSIR